MTFQNFSFASNFFKRIQLSSKQNEVIHYQIQRHGSEFFSFGDQIPVRSFDELMEQYRASQASQDGSLIHLVPILSEGSMPLVTPQLVATTSDVPSPPPPESRKHGRTTLLHRATRKGSIDVVEAMLKSSNQRTLDAEDEEGRTVAHLACMLTENAERILETLLSHGANVNCRDESGNTPLHVSVHAHIVIEE